jgi:hypothetical protein
MSGAALVLALAAAAGSPCDRKDLVPAGAAKVNERALLDAACGPECVLECPEYDESLEEQPQQLAGHDEGSFECAGRLESIVTLFPCHDAAGMHGVAGTIMLLRATRPPGKSARGLRWEQAGNVENGVLNGACKTVRAGERDVLACLVAWGPYQGIMGQTLCVLHAAGGFAMDCPLRVSDSCNAGIEGAVVAEIESWDVGPPGSGGIPVRARIKSSGCDGKDTRTLDAVVLMDASGARLSPETEELLKKVDVGQQ